MLHLPFVTRIAFSLVASIATALSYLCPYSCRSIVVKPKTNQLQGGFTMASASKLEMVNRTLRGVLLSEKGGVAINRVQGDYRDFTGTSLPFKEFGYASLEAFLRSIPNVVSLHRGPDGVVLCKCVTDDSTQRIGSLVNRQKGKKKGKGSGITAKPGRPNARLAKPVYQSNPSHKPRPIRPKFQASKQAPQQVRFLKQQNYARPGQQSINWVSCSPPKQTPPTKQLSTKPTNSSFSANSSKPKQHSASTVYQSAASSNEAALTTQQPAPRPWSGKLGAKRNKQLASSTLADDLQGQPDEAANQTGQSATYENIYITVENDSCQKDRSGNRPKTKFAKGKKQEWSANFDVPPRFKKLMSPTTGVQDHYDNQDSEPNKTSAPVVHTSPSGNFSGDVQIDRTTSDWIQKVLKEKPNGIWASALCDMHKKVFDQTLDPGVIGTMAQHNLIQRESIMGSVILYPKLTVCLGDSSVSKTTQRSVTLGPRDHPEVGGAAEKENQTGNGSLRRGSSDNLSPRTASPGVSLPGGNPSAPDDQLLRNTPPQDSDAAGITHSLVGVRLAETQSPASASTEETPSEPRGGLVLSNLEVPGVPSLQLPEENEWDVYVAYITSLSDFWVILIGDEYSEQLIILEEEMRTFYQCCTWTLTEPPEAGDCYAAEFNREWLRVEVKSVEGDKVQCFLLDHGDLETADITSLRPLSETFLQLPFQVVRCKLTGCEQVANDDQTALQMFCQLALGKSLLAEITSRDGDCIVMELFDDSDVSVLEQCMTAGI